jgi:hypothetical protein
MCVYEGYIVAGFCPLQISSVYSEYTGAYLDIYDLNGNNVNASFTDPHTHYINKAAFPVTGIINMFYVADDTGIWHRWGTNPVGHYYVPSKQYDIIRPISVYGQSGTGANMIPCNGILYVYSHYSTTQVLTVFNSIDDPGTVMGTISHNIFTETCISHNNKIYGMSYSSGIGYLYVSVNGLTFTDTGIILPYTLTSLTSVATPSGIMAISCQAQNQFIPTVNFIPDSML